TAVRGGVKRSLPAGATLDPLAGAQEVGDRVGQDRAQPDMELQGSLAAEGLKVLKGGEERLLHQIRRRHLPDEVRRQVGTNGKLQCLANQRVAARQACRGGDPPSNSAKKVGKKGK